MKIISFFFEKNHFYLIIILLILIPEYFFEKKFLKMYIHKKYKIKKDLFEFYLDIFRYFGQSLILIPYFISYCKNKKSKKKKLVNNELVITIFPINNNNELNDYKKILFYAFILSMMEMFLAIFSKSIVEYDEDKKFKYYEIQICTIILCYNYLFKKEFYIHRKISFYIFLFILIFKVIYNLNDLNIKKGLIDMTYNLFHYFFVGFKIIILKYIINYFYISGYLLLGFEGLFDLIFYFIYYYFSFGIKKNIFNKIYCLVYLVITVLYFILHIFITFLITAFDPILYTLNSFLYLLFQYFFENKDEFLVVNTIFNTINCFCILIFSEVIQINVCNLDKETKINIIEREKNEKKLYSLDLYN